MATMKQRTAARRNIRKAISTAKRKRSIAHMPRRTRTALSKQASAVRQRRRTGGAHPKTRAELYAEAKRCNISGRSKMGRAQLLRALGRPRGY